MRLRRYPFDKQECFMRIESCKYQATERNMPSRMHGNFATGIIMKFLGHYIFLHCSYFATLSITYISCLYTPSIVPINYQIHHNDFSLHPTIYLCFQLLAAVFFTQQNVPAEYEVKQTTSLLISQMVFTTAPSGAYILDTAYVWPVT